MRFTVIAIIASLAFLRVSVCVRFTVNGYRLSCLPIQIYINIYTPSATASDVRMKRNAISTFSRRLVCACHVVTVTS